MNNNNNTCYVHVINQFLFMLFVFDSAVGRQAGACPRARGRKIRPCRRAVRGAGWRAPRPAACHPGTGSPAYHTAHLKSPSLRWISLTASYQMAALVGKIQARFASHYLVFMMYVYFFDLDNMQKEKTVGVLDGRLSKHKLISCKIDHLR